MDCEDDELLCSFVEDSREHLAAIEQGLLDLESQAADADTDLVNRIFRTAHSIKGTAGFLGLTCIASLAHRLENVLHLIRDGSVVPGRDVCGALMRGFDLLSSMVEAPQDDWEEASSDLASTLAALLTEPARAAAERQVAVQDAPGRRAFEVDELTLTEALKGGKFLYHVQFDLINDIHRQNRTPVDVFRTLIDSGLVLDCKIDLEAVGDLASGPSRSIPLSVLYATIIDPEIAGLLFGVSGDKIRVVENAGELIGAEPEEAAKAYGKADGEYEVSRENGAAVIRLGQCETVEHAHALKAALLESFAGADSVLLDAADLREVDLSFVQLVASAARTAERGGKTFGFMKPPGRGVQSRFKALGLDLFGGSGA